MPMQDSLVTPLSKELGLKFSNLNAEDFNKKFILFIEAINIILDYASQFKVDFYIENNVLAEFNFDQNNISFCCESQNILSLFNK